MINNQITFIDDVIDLIALDDAPKTLDDYTDYSEVIPFELLEKHYKGQIPDKVIDSYNNYLTQCQDISNRKLPMDKVYSFLGFVATLSISVLGTALMLYEGRLEIGPILLFTGATQAFIFGIYLSDRSIKPTIQMLNQEQIPLLLKERK